MRIREWYRSLDQPDRTSLSNIVYCPLNIALGLWVALAYDAVIGWALAGFALCALVFNNVNDLVLLASYRRTYQRKQRWF